MQNMMHQVRPPTDVARERGPASEPSAAATTTELIPRPSDTRAAWMHPHQDVAPEGVRAEGVVLASAA